MTKIFGADWWPAGTRRPALRLAAGLALAPALLTAAATGATFAISGSALPDAETVGIAAAQAALAVGIGLPVFTLSFGLAAILGLWAARRRTALAFAAGGAVAGGAFAAVTALLFDTPMAPGPAAVLGGLGAADLLIVRAVAGIRAVPPRA